MLTAQIESTTPPEDVIFCWRQIVFARLLGEGEMAIKTKIKVS
jgi:hypothetical protein